MRTLHQLALLVALLFGGCIDDNLKECSKIQSVLIKFRYQEAGTDVFAKTISVVHLFVFDKDDKHFVLSKQIDQTSLNQLQGVELQLPKGNYQVVCWANAALNSEFCSLNNVSHLDDNSETYISNAKPNTVNGYAENGDKLYYAPYLDSNSFFITVSDLSKTEYTMDFRTAHTTIDVYVTGFTDMSAKATSLSPNIELTNITPKYDFKFNKFGDPITYRQTAINKNIEGIETQVASFNTPLFAANKDVEIVLRKQSTNQVAAMVNLNQFINEHYNYINFLRPQPVHLKIEFRFVNGNIEISIPRWDNEIVNPEI